MKFPVILYEWSHLLLKIISACFAGFHLLPISFCPTYLSFLASFEHLPLTSQWHMALSSFLSVFIPWVISVHPSFTYHPYTDDAYLSSLIHDSFHKFQPSIVCHLLYHPVSSQVCHTGSLYLIRLRHIAPSPTALLVTLFYILCNPFHDILFCTMKAEKLQLTCQNFLTGSLPYGIQALPIRSPCTGLGWEWSYMMHIQSQFMTKDTGSWSHGFPQWQWLFFSPGKGRAMLREGHFPRKLSMNVDPQTLLKLLSVT